MPIAAPRSHSSWKGAIYHYLTFGAAITRNLTKPIALSNPPDSKTVDEEEMALLDQLKGESGNQGGSIGSKKRGGRRRRPKNLPRLQGQSQVKVKVKVRDSQRGALTKVAPNRQNPCHPPLAQT
jgi:hypothetical protein